MQDKYLKVIEALGEVIISKELSISVLEYENKQLKEKIASIENYVTKCESVNN